MHHIRIRMQDLHADDMSAALIIIILKIRGVEAFTEQANTANHFGPDPRATPRRRPRQHDPIKRQRVRILGRQPLGEPCIRVQEQPTILEWCRLDAEVPRRGDTERRRHPPHIHIRATNPLSHGVPVERVTIVDNDDPAGVTVEATDATLEQVVRAEDGNDYRRLHGRHVARRSIAGRQCSS